MSTFLAMNWPGHIESRFKSYFIFLLLILTALVDVCAADAVRVRGYTRRDGTYVAPHYRSAPDGNFYNNWSTLGNVNPYTGRVGTKTTPSSADRSREAELRARYGIPLPPTFPTYPESTPLKLIQPESKIPSKEPALSYTDDDMRKRKAEEIKALGVEVDWKKHDFSELLDLQSKVRKASDLKDLGIKADWKKLSYAELSDMEARIKKANHLKTLGVEVGWWNHSWSELFMMEQKLISTQKNGNRTE